MYTFLVRTYFFFRKKKWATTRFLFYFLNKMIRTLLISYTFHDKGKMMRRYEVGDT
jgi:hypothetical protein